MVKFKPGVLLFPGRLKISLPSGLFVFNCFHLYTIDLPPHIKKGKYELKFKLVDTRSLIPRDVFSGLKDRMMDKASFIRIGQVDIGRR
jgi:hypothetical protein